MTNASPRISLLAVGIAALGFFATPTVSWGGTAEIAAITQKLPANVTIATATADQLRIAVRAVIEDAALTKLKPEVVTAEALKGTTDSGTGAAIGADLFGAPPTRITNLDKFAAATAVSASTGKTANSTNVPEFAAQFVTTDAQAITIAKLAVKSPSAIGAIIGGRALDLDSNPDTDLLALANLAIADKKLTKGTQQIAQYVSRSIDDVVNFAFELTKPRLGSLQKVATGVTAENPIEADAVVTKLRDSQETAATVVKIAPKLAKSVGLVADPEQVAFLGKTLGEKISAKQVNATGKALIQAISQRKTLNGTSQGGIDNTLANKSDEIGEITSTFIATVAQNTLANSALSDPKKGATFVFNLVKTMFKAAKIKTIKSINQTSKDLQAALLTKPGFFGASIAYTLEVLRAQNKITQTVFDAIKAKLTGPSASAIGGKPLQVQLVAQFNAGFADTTGAGNFEDGVAGPVNDPETDTRNG